LTSSADSEPKIENTANITSAALVTTPAVAVIPWRTTSRIAARNAGSLVRSVSLWRYATSRGGG
jgi:hypothetical protein